MPFIWPWSPASPPEPEQPAAPAAPEPVAREQVELYTSPWVSGKRAAAYFGPVASELFLPDAEVEDRASEWAKAELELFDKLRDTARMLGANSVVGLEIKADPFAERESRLGLHLHAVGTGARLEPLF